MKGRRGLNLMLEQYICYSEKRLQTPKPILRSNYRLKHKMPNQIITAIKNIKKYQMYIKIIILEQNVKITGRWWE